MLENKNIYYNNMNSKKMKYYTPFDIRSNTDSQSKKKYHFEYSNNDKVNIKNQNIDKQSMYSNLIDEESNLLQSKNSSKRKSTITLKNNIHPLDYQISIKDDNNIFPSQTELTNSINYANNYEPGRGFGNLDISNDIRNGFDSRSDIDGFRLQREENISCRFEYIDKNFQDPDKLILPFSRGGENTRSIGKKILPNNYKYSNHNQYIEKQVKNKSNKYQFKY